MTNVEWLVGVTMTLLIGFGFAIHYGWFEKISAWWKKRKGPPTAGSPVTPPTSGPKSPWKIWVWIKTQYGKVGSWAKAHKKTSAILALLTGLIVSYTFVDAIQTVRGLAIALLTVLVLLVIGRRAMLEKISQVINENQKTALSISLAGPVIVLLLLGEQLWLLGFAIALILQVSALLWAYLIIRTLALRYTFFTASVRQGRIHFVMVSGKAKKCLANLREQGKWVHPETGVVWQVIRKKDSSGKTIITHGKKFSWQKEETPEEKAAREAEETKKGWINGLPPITTAQPEYTLMNVSNPILRFLEEEFGWYLMSWQPDAKLWSGMFSRYQAKGERGPNEPPPTTANIELEYRQEETFALFPKAIYGIDVKAITGIEKSSTEAVATATATNDNSVGKSQDPSALTTTGTPPPIVSQNIEVLLRFAVEVEITDALLAQFGLPSNPYFLTAVMKSMESAVKQTVSGMTYDTLTTETIEGPDSRWFDVVKELNQDQAGGNPSLVEKHGVMITAIHLLFQSITDPNLATVVANRAKSKLVAETKIQEADGEMKATFKENLGEQDKIDKVDRPRQKLAIELLEARKTNDPKGLFADAEARGKWTGLKYYAPGDKAGAVPLLNLDVDKPDLAEVKKEKADDAKTKPAAETKTETTADKKAENQDTEKKGAVV